MLLMVLLVLLVLLLQLLLLLPLLLHWAIWNSSAAAVGRALGASNLLTMLTWRWRVALSLAISGLR